MSKKEVLKQARRLVQEAVDVGNRAGIDPSYVVAPHCAETIAAETATPQDGSDGRGSENVEWCGVPVIIDNATSDLFEMPQPDDDPGQKAAFTVTQSTANLVRQDFGRYKPSLDRMAEDWQENKKLLCIKKVGDI